jgi:hypothetical protein
VQRLFFAVALFTTLYSTHALSFGSIYCGQRSGNFTCVAALRFSDYAQAEDAARTFCTRQGISSCYHFLGPLTNFCRSIFAFGDGQPFWRSESSHESAFNLALSACEQANCLHVLTVCEDSDIRLTPALVGPDGVQVSAYPQPPPPASSSPAPAATRPISRAEAPRPAPPGEATVGFTDFFDPHALGVGISFGIGLLLALSVFVARAPLINLIIHGNLPYKLPVYGEDIQCLFKRTQRVNWYGRIVFGVVANLSMTHDQLSDVRKYWLGRVIAFDSLRRQRQNQLATMHLQLAAKAKSDAHDKKKFWSRRWATLRSFVKKLFWVVIALFNLVMGLFFIRVNIAKLVRGTIVESKDLTLILQAKEAIEESTTYLKEYLITANTFDGRDEIYEPE